MTVGKFITVKSARLGEIIWKIPVGMLKRPNIVLIVYRMRVQKAMEKEGRGKYPRRTHPRRNEEEFGKHMFMLIPRAFIDYIVLTDVQKPGTTTMIAYTMGVPNGEKIVKTLSVGTMRKALTEAAIRTKKRREKTHVYAYLGDIGAGEHFFYTGNDHDLVITSGPDLYIGREIECKGSSVFDDYLNDTRKTGFVLELGFRDLVNSILRYQSVTLDTRIALRFSDKDSRMVSLTRVTLHRSLSSIRMDPDAIVERRKRQHDFLIDSLYELHDELRGRYSRRIRTKLDFDPDL